MKGFKYYVNLTGNGRGWEVVNDDNEVMGIYASQAEAHAAISAFVSHDVEELQHKLNALMETRTSPQSVIE